MKPMIAYIRVSSVGGRDVESDRYQTETTQLEEIERWGRERGLTVVSGAQFVDRDESGAKEDRPGFAAAMEEVRSGRAGGIVVATLDRFSRQSTIDVLRRVKDVQDAGGTVASVGGEVPVDPTTPAGEFQLTIFAAIARMQWREYDRRWRVAKQRAAGRGVQIARPPLGYQHGPDGRLEPSPLARAITETFRVAASEGQRAALTYIRGADVGAPERRWNPPNLRRVLSRRVYLGELNWNGSVALQDAHKALTDLATWTRAQHSPLWRRAANSKYPLSSGPARCGTCGSHMVGALAKGGGRRGYRCSTGGGAKRKAACGTKAWIYADPLEEYTLKLLVLEAEHREMDPQAHPEVVPEREDTRGDISEAEIALGVSTVRREEFAKADIEVSPEAWAARARALDLAVEEAQERYETAVAEAAPHVVIPRSEEIRSAGVDGIAEFLARFELVVRVAPGRAPVSERVSLVKP